jgi:hypothetical protein
VSDNAYGITSVLRRWGALDQAAAIEGCAQHLLAWWDEQLYREVTTEEAIEISGFSRSGLERLRECGKLTKAGDAGEPRYIPVELPRKARRLPPKTPNGEPDLAAEVLPFRRTCQRAERSTQARNPHDLQKEAKTSG